MLEGVEEGNGVEADPFVERPTGDEAGGLEESDSKGECVRFEGLRRLRVDWLIQKAKQLWG